MIQLYTWATPNGKKVSIMLEEIGHSLRGSSCESQPARADEARVSRRQPE